MSLMFSKICRRKEKLLASIFFFFFPSGDRASCRGADRGDELEDLSALEWTGLEVGGGPARSEKKLQRADESDRG